MTVFEITLQKVHRFHDLVVCINVCIKHELIFQGARDRLRDILTIKNVIILVKLEQLLNVGSKWLF